jgi:hypothetical protein
MSAESFLTRWARRKQEAAKGAPGDEPAAPQAGESAAGGDAGARAADASPDASPEASRPRHEEPPVEPPSLDEIDADFDVSAWIDRNVPEEWKTAALRKVWASDPAIRDFVGLQEYDWDFNDPAGIPGFGPLSPDIDVEKMLAQVMNGIEVEPPPASALAEGGDELSHGARAGAGDAAAGADSVASQHGDREDGAEPEQPGEADVKVRDSLDDAADGPQQLAQPAAGELAAPQKELEDTVLPRPVRRRGGGAVPV